MIVKEHLFDKKFTLTYKQLGYIYKDPITALSAVTIFFTVFFILQFYFSYHLGLSKVSKTVFPIQHGINMNAIARFNNIFIGAEI